MALTARCRVPQGGGGDHAPCGGPRLSQSWESTVRSFGQFGVDRPFRLCYLCGRDQVGPEAGVKAVVHDRYGSPDVLRVEEVPVPSPAAGQVRVKIAATSVNLSDWECLRGSPAYARIDGLRFPARRTLGSDIAGLVDDVGEGVTRFRPGDEVYGDNLRLKGASRSTRSRRNPRSPTSRTSSPSLRRRPSRRRARSPCRARRGRDGSPGADQRRWRRVGILRDSAREAARCSRHRC